MEASRLPARRQTRLDVFLRISQSKSMKSRSSRRTARRKTSCDASSQSNKCSSIVGGASRKESLEVDPPFWISTIWRRMFFKMARDFLVEKKRLDPPGNALEKFRLAVQSVRHAFHKPMFKTRLHETFLQMHLRVPLERALVKRSSVLCRTPKEKLQSQQEHAVQATFNDAKDALMMSCMLQTLHAPCGVAIERLLQEATEAIQLHKLQVESAKVAVHHEALDSQLGDCCDRITSLHERSTRDLNLGTKLSKQMQNDILRARRIIAASSSGEHQDWPAQQLEEEPERKSMLRRKTLPPKMPQPLLDDPAEGNLELHGTNSGKQAGLQPLLEDPAGQTPEVHGTNSGKQAVLQPTLEDLVGQHGTKSGKQADLQPLLEDPVGQTPEVHGSNSGKQAGLQPLLEDPVGQTPEVHGTNRGKQAGLQPLLERSQRPEAHGTNRWKQAVLHPLLEDLAGKTPEVHDTNSWKQAVLAVLVELQNVINYKSPDTGRGDADQPATDGIAKICSSDDPKSQRSSSSPFDSSEDEAELHEMEPALPNPVPVLPPGRSRKPGGAERKPATMSLCEAPRALGCGGCLTKPRDNLDWKNYRHSRSHSASAEAADLNNNHGTESPRPHDLTGGFSLRNTALDKQVIQVASEAVAKMPTHPEQQKHQVEEDRHTCQAKLSESALAAGVALFLGNASHSTDAVLAALRVAVPEVPAQSHVTTNRVTPGFAPHVKAQPDRPFPIEVSYCEISRNSAFALEQNALNPSSSKCEEDKGEKQPYQGPGQIQAAWSVQANSAMEARSQLAHRPCSASCTRDTSSSWKSTARNSSWRFDFADALSKAGRQKDVLVLGNPSDSFSPRRPRSAQTLRRNFVESSAGSKCGKVPSFSKW